MSDRPIVRPDQTMDKCPICEHPKREAIDAALLSGRHYAVVARQYRLDPEAVAKHPVVHHKQNRDAQPIDTPQGAETQVVATYGVRFAGEETARLRVFAVDDVHAEYIPEDPVRSFKHHVHEAARVYRQECQDRLKRERMQMILQDAFASDDWGLP